LSHSPVELLMRYRDAVACRLGHGRPLPAGLDAALWQKVDGAATRSVCGAFQGGVDAGAERRQLALRLAVGRFLHHVLDVMEWPPLAPQQQAAQAQQKATTPPWLAIDNLPLDNAACYEPPRLFLYSGHDWTIMPLLMALRPSYGCSPSGATPTPTAAAAADDSGEKRPVSLSVFISDDAGLTRQARDERKANSMQEGVRSRSVGGLCV
jgi:hypothetical protein